MPSDAQVKKGGDAETKKQRFIDAACATVIEETNDSPLEWKHVNLDNLVDVYRRRIRELLNGN